MVTAVPSEPELTLNAMAAESAVEELPTNAEAPPDVNRKAELIAATLPKDVRRESTSRFVGKILPITGNRL
jgi:hypothetical protein